MTSNEWIEHDGKGCPVEPHVTVEVRLRKGDASGFFAKAGWWNGDAEWWPMSGSSNWDDTGSAHDIIAYRVVSDV